MSETDEKKKQKVTERSKRFVEQVLRRCGEDRGFAARLRRADNPDTAYQSWGLLAGLGVNIEEKWDCLSSAMIGAALARLEEGAKDGRDGLGTALRVSFETAEQGESRLRRLLACRRREEVCEVLRPILRLVASRSPGRLSHAKLLDDLRKFSGHNEESRDSIKRRWASEYYFKPEEGSDVSERVSAQAQ